MNPVEINPVKSTNEPISDYNFNYCPIKMRLKPLQIFESSRHRERNEPTRDFSSRDWPVRVQVRVVYTTDFVNTMPDP